MPEDNVSTHASRPQDVLLMERTRKYRQAAAGYLIYGLIYLLGAMHLSGVGEGPATGWLWFIVGAAMAVIFPLLIWTELKWVARILAFLVAIRVIGLIRIIIQGDSAGIEMPWGGEISLVHGAIIFAVIAAAECYLLVRAGWNL